MSKKKEFLKGIDNALDYCSITSGKFWVCFLFVFAVLVCIYL